MGNPNESVNSASTLKLMSNMRKFVVIICTMLSALNVYSQQAEDPYGKPIIILTERNPWLMVIGSDTPTFALYEKGHVIYKRLDDKKLTIFEGKLEPEQLNSFVAGLGLSDSFYKLPEEIVASSWTDQPTNLLELHISTPKKISVYGNLRSPAKDLSRSVPEELLLVLEKLIAYSDPSARVWSPKVMEVMFWDFSYAKEKKAWPKGLPDLKSPSTRKLPNGVYSVYLTADHYDAFKKFYPSIGERTAVEINGKKMTMSARYPFPNIR